MQAVMTSSTMAIDPHVEWGRCLERLTRRLDMLPDHAKDAVDQLWSDRQEVEEMIASTPAETLAGIEQQVALALYQEAEASQVCDTGLQALRTAQASLRRLAERSGRA